MKYILANIDNLIYTYNPEEFFPVRYEGKLTNKGEFMLYKSKKAIQAITRVIAEARK